MIDRGHNRRQEAVRLLTEYQAQLDEWATTGDNPLAAIGVGVQRGRPASKPLIENFPSGDFRRAEQLLRVVREVNPGHHKHLVVWAEAGFRIPAAAKRLRRNGGAFRGTLSEALTAFEMAMYCLPPATRLPKRQ